MKGLVLSVLYIAFCGAVFATANASPDASFTAVGAMGDLLLGADAESFLKANIHEQIEELESAHLTKAERGSRVSLLEKKVTVLEQRQRIDVLERRVAHLEAAFGVGPATYTYHASGMSQALAGGGGTGGAVASGNPGPVSVTSGTISGKYAPSAAAKAASDRMGKIQYDGSGPWRGSGGCVQKGMMQGTRVLKAFLMKKFPQSIRSIGGYSCRQNTANKNKISVHGTGRALDIMIPLRGGKADNGKGDPVANWLIEHAKEIGMQYLIWDRTKWSGSRNTKFGNYGGPHPHHDHLHIELNLAAGAKGPNPWWSDGGSSAAAPATQQAAASAPARTTTGGTQQTSSPSAPTRVPTGGGCPLMNYDKGWGSVFINKKPRIERGFARMMDVIHDAAKANGIQVYVTSHYRSPGQQIRGAIVPPASKSNHKVGHAIDFNLKGSFGFCNGRCIQRLSHAPVRNFIAACKAAGMRWGGDWSRKDPVHLDDGINKRNAAGYDAIYVKIGNEC